MVELKSMKVVEKKNPEDDTLIVEIPANIVEGLGLNEDDRVEWTYSINCKNQRIVTMKRKYP